LHSYAEWPYPCLPNSPIATTAAPIIPRNEMRLMVTKTGKRWRCIRSIEATQQGREAREAYGRLVSEINRAESKSRAQRLNNLLQEK
jgi:hypothetical protein